MYSLGEVDFIQGMLDFGNFYGSSSPLEGG